jgi:hypothetical protein
VRDRRGCCADGVVQDTVDLVHRIGVGRLVDALTQPPWSIAQSTITEPFRMDATSGQVTRPGPARRASTAPMTRSASPTALSTASRLLARVRSGPGGSGRPAQPVRWVEGSTSASMPWASAAFQPTLPAPSTTTRAGRTRAPAEQHPGRRAPLEEVQAHRGAIRPATSLISASSNSAPVSACTVSCAMPVTFFSSRASATAGAQPGR